MFLEFEELRGVGYVYLDGCLSVYFPLYFTCLTCYFYQYQVPYYFNQYQVLCRRLLLMIALHHQTKTPIGFLCRRKLNLRSLIQPLKTITIELTGTHI